MFWKFNLESSGLDTLLAKPDVTLLDVLDEEDVLQECKTPNEKLLEFLTQDEVLKELLHLVIDVDMLDVDEAIKYKYMNISCEIIILDVDIILETIANNQEYLDIIWSFTDNLPPLNPLIASFFSKVITMLVCRKGQQTFQYLKSHDAVNKLIVHIEISAIMELFIKLITAVEQPNLRAEISRWLDEEKLIQKLIEYIHPSQDEEKQYFAGQLLSELVRISRDSISQFIDDDQQSSTESPLLLTLEKKETIEKLLSVMFDDMDQPNSDSSVLNGITAFQSLIEIKRPTIEGMEELMSQMDVERIAQGCQVALEVLATRLSDLHDALVRPYPMSSMETTFGTLDPPLGKVRLAIAGLIASAISTNTYIINESLSKTGTMNVLLDLFYRYEWNNFLHTYVQHSIFGILSGEIHQTVDDENSGEERCPDILLKHLFQECNVVQRCLTLWEANEISEKSGKLRKGYMGHLTKIINQMKTSREKGPNVETIQSMFNEFSDEIRTEWNELVEGSLHETNSKNICAPMNSWFSHMDSDSEGDDYRPISISQYDGTLQQAFENYQVQPMSNEFIETFGYDEESLGENENIKNPLDEVGNIDFTINANEISENEKLFDNICEAKIRPFDDDSDSEEEDMWEEKELTFSSPSQPRVSDAIRSDSDSSSDEEKDSKGDCSGNACDPFVDPFAPANTEKMEVDSDWTANFDSFGVSTQDVSSDWPNVVPVATASLSTSGDNFANFTDIASFDICNETSTPKYVAMETDSSVKPNASSAYEVKMEEENIHNSPDGNNTESQQKNIIGDEVDQDGIALVEIVQSASSSTTSKEDTSPTISSTVVQSISLNAHIDSSNNPEKIEKVVTNIDERPPEKATKSPDILTSAIETTKESLNEKGEVEPVIHDNERTSKNEIIIPALNKAPAGLSEKTVDTACVESDSVLHNGPPSSEVCVNATGNLAT